MCGHPHYTDNEIQKCGHHTNPNSKLQKCGHFPNKKIQKCSHPHFQMQHTLSHNSYKNVGILT